MILSYISLPVAIWFTLNLPLSRAAPQTPITLTYSYTGCYIDNPAKSSHILPTSLGPLTTLSACLQQCDTFSLTACGITAPDTKTAAGGLCIGGAWTTDNWRVYGRADEGLCKNVCTGGGSCGGEGVVSVYQVGWGKEKITYLGNTPNGVPAEVTERDKQASWVSAGCYKQITSSPLSLSTILMTDSTVDDCLAVCSARGIKDCIVGFGGRVCYGDVIDATKWTGVELGECDATCRFGGSGGYDRCGGMRDDGVRISVYQQGVKTSNTTIVPNNLPSIPTTPPTSESKSTSSTTQITSSKTLSPIAITSITISTLFILICGTTFVISRRRKSQSLPTTTNRRPSLLPSKRATWGLPKFYPSYTYTNPALLSPKLDITKPDAVYNPKEGFGLRGMDSESSLNSLWSTASGSTVVDGVLPRGERGHVAPWEV